MSAAALATRQTAALAWRSIITTLRLPQAWFPALFFPLVLMAIFTASFGGAPGNLPGFPPIRGFLDFAVCGAIVQGVLIAGTTAGAAFATDIEHGFFDRLVASPTSRVSILTGRLGASVALGVVQALLFLSIAAIFGARVEGGFWGVVVVVGVTVDTVGSPLLPVTVTVSGTGASEGDSPGLVTRVVVVVGVLSVLVRVMARPPTVTAANTAAMPKSKGGRRYQGSRAESNPVWASGSISAVGRESARGEV